MKLEEEGYPMLLRQLFDPESSTSFREDTLVYPAHDYKGMTVTTIAEEKRLNPRVAGKSRRELIELMNHLDLSVMKKIMEAVPANRACGLAPVHPKVRSDAQQDAQHE